MHCQDYVTSSFLSVVYSVRDFTLLLAYLSIIRKTRLVNLNNHGHIKGENSQKGD